MKLKLSIFCLLLLLLLPGSLPARNPPLHFTRTHEPQEKKLYTQARACEKDGLIDEAILLLNQCVNLPSQLEPYYTSASLKLAQLYLQSNQPAEAEKAIRRNIKKIQQLYISREVHLERLLLLAESLAAQEKWAEVAELTAPLCNSTTPQKYWKSALLLLADSALHVNVPDALQLLKDFRKKYPRGAKAIPVQARIFELALKENDNETVQKILQQLQEEHSRNAALLGLYAASRKQNLPLAIQFYDTANAEKPETLPQSVRKEVWKAYRVFADLLAENKRNPEAIQAWEHAMEYADTPEKKILGLQQIFQHSLLANQPDKAEDILSQFAESFPAAEELPPLFYAMAQDLCRRNLYLPAAKYFRELSRMSQTSAAQLRYNAAMHEAECLSLSRKESEAYHQYLQAEKSGRNPTEQCTARLAAAKTALSLHQTTGEADWMKRAAEDYRIAAENHPQLPEAKLALYTSADLSMRLKDYRAASEKFFAFADRNPQDPQADTASLLGYSALRISSREDYTALRNIAMKLEKLRDKTGDASLREKIIFEAFYAYSDAHATEMAEKVLLPLTQKENSPYYEEAKFQCVMMHFALQHNETARQEAKDFLQLFSTSPRRHEMRMALGDSYAAEQKWADALQIYAPDEIIPEDMPMEIHLHMLYESAFCCRELQKPDEALDYLQRLFSVMESPKSSQENTAESFPLLAKASFLEGILNQTLEKTDEALASYARCQTFAGESDIGLTALGLQGKLLLQKAKAMGHILHDKEQMELLERANRCFSQLTEKLADTHTAKLAALYHMGETLELQSQIDSALQNYRNIYLLWRTKIENRTAQGNYYFANALLRAARLLEERGSQEDLHLAASIYQILVDAKLEISPSANIRRQELLRTLTPTPSK